MKDHKELIKSLAIAILLTANIAFFAGILYNQRQQNQLKAEVQTQIQSLKDQLQLTTK